MIRILTYNCNSHRADTVARGTRDLKFSDTSRHSTADTGDRYTRLLPLTKGLSHMKIYLILSLLLFSSCMTSPNLKYGFLPASGYPFYAPRRYPNLMGKKIVFVINDKRHTIYKANCTNESIQRDSELEGKLGSDYFSDYITKLSSESYEAGIPDTVLIDLEVLTPAMIGFGFVKVHGIVQFKVYRKKFTKSYCVDIKDGDSESPINTFSFDTRRGAMRKMMSAALTKVGQEFLEDYELELKNERQ